MSTDEMEKYKDKDREEEVGTCIMGEMRKDREVVDWQEKYKRENNNLYNRIADSLEVNESHQKMNGKLQERLTELEEENKKMHDHLNKRINNARKSGM